ncbi:MAG: hypothetical protein FWD36_04380 [Treponema sp.]|nr:hypothetical protein [Treponema sp.]
MAISPERKNGHNRILALLLGCIAVVFQYFFGPLVTPGGFGFSRWMSGFIDIVGLPVIIPLVFCLILVKLRFISCTPQYALFTLLYLIPLAAIRSISVHSLPSLIPLVIVPLLWIAQAVGIPFFIGYIRQHTRWYILIPLAIGIAALPVAAVSSWWAFFSQQNFLGSMFLLVSFIPAAAFVLLHRDTLRLSRRP